MAMVFMPCLTNSVLFVVFFLKALLHLAWEKKRKRKVHTTSGKIKALDCCRSDVYDVVKEFFF